MYGNGVYVSWELSVGVEEVEGIRCDFTFFIRIISR